ncbi:P-loop containing nucleoside triphosphate hydrolase protein [Lactarius tabidus]
MSTLVATVLGLNDRLDFIQTCPFHSLDGLVSNLGLHERLPVPFLDTLDEDDMAICYRAALICYSITGSAQVPREMQLRVVLANQNGRDCLVSAGTGSGKTTLPIALNALLDDPDKSLVTLTLLPLKRLQMTQESDFNSRYGIPTVSRKGHFPHLAMFVRNLRFQKHIAQVIVDEAHNIHTAGLPHYGLDAFRPAWGHLDELKAILPWSVCWTLLSAMFLPHIRATVEKKIMCQGFDAIHITSNRPNTIYATHEVLNNIEDLQNYDCFVASPFSVDSQPRVLIFVDKKELACRIAAYLDANLPVEHQNKGIVRHYHSKMSQQYLQLAHEAFTDPSGTCRVLVATSGQSVGVDFPDVKIVCTVGLPGTMVDILQRGGRALRNSDDNTLFVIFYEPWVHDVPLEEYSEGDLGDPDRPRCTLKQSSQQHDCVPFSCLKLFASYLNDASSIALSHTATLCCTAEGCDGQYFELQGLLPGKLAVAPLPPSTDPFCCVCPLDIILLHSQRATLVCADLSQIKCAQDVMALLDETAEWDAEWAAKVVQSRHRKSTSKSNTV